MYEVELGGITFKCDSAAGILELAKQGAKNSIIKKSPPKIKRHAITIRWEKARKLAKKNNISPREAFREVK